MEYDKILLNDDEFLIIGTWQQKLFKLFISSIKKGNHVIGRSSVVRNLGSFIDDKLTMDNHINELWNIPFYYIHIIWQIRKYLSPDSAEALIHTFVTNQLDYCNT